ncbi:hypothetical protein H2201_002457 [Coniosporium apollinis]|uniref:Uncharacterized protein n=1 Tax=Coniosporium apollinis TaxID=61459 RepID=A0ABQ9NZV3_9PEZI|nr:hypothetical protein H2201_002457 [Coniosporium apollinis]
MFGPLIIEAGLPDTNHGVLISPRALPPLCFDYNAATSVINPPEVRTSGNYAPQCTIVFKDKTSRTRRLLHEPRKIPARNTLASVKCAYGAAFSGYIDADALKEAAVIDAFISASRRCNFGPAKSVRARHRHLHRVAGGVIDKLCDLISNQVDVHLRRLAKILIDPGTNVSWHMVRNNCQKLIDRLLSGKDFEYIFPRLPKPDARQGARAASQALQWPRYLISFGDRIDSSSFSVPQPNSFVTKFRSRRGSQGDLIDFIEFVLGIDQLEFPADEVDRVSSDRWREILLLPFVDGGEDHSDGNLTAEVIDTLWLLPRDTLSILQTHILRPYTRYFNATGNRLNLQEWIINRLRLLRQLDVFSSLAGGLGSALLSLFVQDMVVAQTFIIPKSRVFGTARADDRILIFRASPRAVSYLILNRRVDQALVEAGSEDSLEAVLKNLIEKLPEATKRALPSPVRLAKALKFPSGPIPVAPVGGGGAIAYLNLILKFLLGIKKIYDRDGWFIVPLADGVVFLQQHFKKSKTIR